MKRKPENVRTKRIRFGTRTKRRKIEYNETMIENISLAKGEDAAKHKSLLFRACWKQHHCAARPFPPLLSLLRYQIGISFSLPSLHSSFPSARRS